MKLYFEVIKWMLKIVCIDTAVERQKSVVPPDRKPLFKSEKNQLFVIVACTAALLFISWRPAGKFLF